MKKITLCKYLILTVFIFFYCSLQAQTFEIKNVTKEGFKGLRALDDKGYYIQYIEGTTGKGKAAKTNLRFFMMDNDLNITSEFALSLSNLEKIEDVAYNGFNFMVILSNKKASTRTLKLLDKTGQEVASKVFSDIPSRLLSKPSAITPLSNGDYLVINYVKEKKIGYNVQRYNDKLEMKFSTDEIPDKRKVYPVDFTLSGDNLFVLEYLDADMSDYYEYHIAAFNINSGALFSKKHLKSSDENSFGYATFLKSTSDGGVITGGMYYNGSKIQEANSDGFFAAKMSADGNLSYTYVDWAKVSGTRDDKNSSLMWGGKTKTFMHDISVNPDGSFTLIGENFRVGDADLAGENSKNGIGGAMKVAKFASGSNAPKKWALTASDFVLMDFDATNNFKTIRKVDKPNAVTIVKPTEDATDPTYLGQFRGLNLANILNNNGYMPYRFVAQSNNNNYLLYWQRYDPVQKEYLYFTPLNATTMDTVSVDITGAEIVYYNKRAQQALNNMGGLGKLVQKANELDKKVASATGGYKMNNFEVRGSDDPNDYRSKSSNTRVIKGNKINKVLMYDFIPDENAEVKTSVFFRQIESLPGTLKIWYMDIPTK